MNVKHGTFHTLAQLAATERNGDLIASGEIVEVCPVVRGAALAAPVAQEQASARNQALEEAAKICEAKLGNYEQHDYNGGYDSGASDCARDIRALIGKEA